MMRLILLALLGVVVLPDNAVAGPHFLLNGNRRVVVRHVERTRPVLFPRLFGTPVIVTPSVVVPTPITPTKKPEEVSISFSTEFVGDGLEEVNAKRMARGLRPFVRDESLTQAARAAAAFRAERGLFGHTGNDFAFLPSGGCASAAGCAAYPAGYGWLSCCTYDNATYAGAAWVTGRDGRRYMHLFVR